jgi:hypothetical protein
MERMCEGRGDRWNSLINEANYTTKKFGRRADNLLSMLPSAKSLKGFRCQ